MCNIKVMHAFMQAATNFIWGIPAEHHGEDTLSQPSCRIVAIFTPVNEDILFPTVAVKITVHNNFSLFH
jgi:hypothetical protein